MVFGGQAVLLHGAPRLTQDIDVTLGADPSHLAAVIAVVHDLGLTPLVEPESFVPETYVLPVRDADSGIRVDLVFSNEGYERAAIARTISVPIAGVSVRFASVEDLLVQKLVAGRPRDLEDARGVLDRQPGADLTYVRRWLSEFDAALGIGAVARLDRLIEDQV